jgi:hypothetical protein
MIKKAEPIEVKSKAATTAVAVEAGASSINGEEYRAMLELKNAGPTIAKCGLNYK